uniref:Uncharacterized protein n=1 Tax=Anguilla anguilla TaxID=7936 RepID=A0A0E9SJZ3_ANGAN
MDGWMHKAVTFFFILWESNPTNKLTVCHKKALGSTCT